MYITRPSSMPSTSQSPSLASLTSYVTANEPSRPPCIYICGGLQLAHHMHNMTISYALISLIHPTLHHSLAMSPPMNLPDPPGHVWGSVTCTSHVYNKTIIHVLICLLRQALCPSLAMSPLVNLPDPLMHIWGLKLVHDHLLCPHPPSLV